MEAPPLTWSLVRRALRKPPRVIFQRAWALAGARILKARARSLPASWRITKLLGMAGARDVDELWTRLTEAPFLFPEDPRGVIDRAFPEEVSRILAEAERAAELEVDMLGSGPVRLQRPIAWSRDFKSGFEWAPAYCHDIAYSDLHRNNDVKVPWELSRFQWALPLAQAYALGREERHAESLAQLVEDWLQANPYAWTVNWSCTMDVGLRAIALIWALHLTRDAKAWTPDRKARVLEGLYGHGHFILRNLEASDINGNHYLADAAGLVFCGLFFDGVGEAAKWTRVGESILESEIPRQIHPDGVDHEASIPYHRLVLELLLLPLLYLEVRGRRCSVQAREALRSMTQFTADYSGPDGRCPRIGDADDGRGIRLGGQPLDDHRYLCHLVGAWLDDEPLLAAADRPWAEAAWWMGGRALRSPWPSLVSRPPALYPDGGFFMLRNDRFHVVGDAGPIGLRGRGGHGHNDATSFEAWVDGERLAVDRGAWVYTADAEGRNAFRATASHNVLQVGSEEINRFVDPLNLWQLQDEARPRIRSFEPGPEGGRVEAEHQGYRRLGLMVSRSWNLRATRLEVHDRIAGDAAGRALTVRLWLAEGVRVELASGGILLETPSGRQHRLGWQAEGGWSTRIVDTDLSPSYGVRIPARCVEWTLAEGRADDGFRFWLDAASS